MTIRKIALGSTAKGDEINIYYKEIARIADLVDVVACAEEVQHSKPHRDIVALALDKLGDPPDRVIAVGDTAYDVEAAAKVGVGSIGVLYVGKLGRNYGRQALWPYTTTQPTCWRIMTFQFSAQQL